MTTVQQAFHIAAKDLRESRWPLFAYGALVVLATMQASSQAALGPFTEPMFFVVIAGMVLVAMLVQADSPVRSDAFWATRPLNPFAVLSAKIMLTFALIIGLPLVGQAIALRMNGAYASDIAHFLPAGIAVYGLWLFAAIVVASYMRDLRTFVVVMLCTSAGLTIGAGMLFSALNNRNAPEPSRYILTAALIVAWLGILASAALVLTLYGRRMRIRGWALAMVVGVACIIYSATESLFSGATPTPTPKSTSNGALPAPPISVSINAENLRLNRSNLNVELTAPPLPPNTQLSFRVAELVLDLRDGSSLRMPTGYQVAEFGSARPQLSGKEWLFPNFDSLPRAPVSVSLDFETRRRIDAGIARVRIAGQLIESHAHALSALPLVPGARAVIHGQRVRVESWAFGSGDAALRLRTWTLPFEEARPTFGTAQAARYVLVNDSARQAIPLSWNGGGGSSTWLVLPGIQASDWTFSLGISEFIRNVRAGPPPTDDWFRAAHLEVFSWEPVARYDIRAEGTVR